MRSSSRHTFQYHDFVGGINVQAPAVNWECNGIIVQRAIGASIMLYTTRTIRGKKSGKGVGTDQ